MTNNKQQTAVEWYIEKLLDLDYEYAKGLITLAVWSERKKSLIEQAKEMEKEQTIKTSLFWSHSTVRRKDIEDYYQQTYGGGDK